MHRHLVLVLLVACSLHAAAQTGVGTAPPVPLPWAPLAPGNATVASGSELLAALAEGTAGNISLSDNIYLTKADWEQYDLPIAIDAPNRTVLIHSDSPGVMRILDWGYAQALLNVTTGTTLALDQIYSRHPGNRTQGIEELGIEIKGSSLWPTVVGQDGHNAVISNGDSQFDQRNCNPEFVKVEIKRIQTQIDQMFGVPGLGEKSVKYVDGVSNYYVNVTFPATLFNTITKQQEGKALYALLNLTSTCYDSSPASTSHGSSSGGGGTPSWVWAIVGSVLGCAALALVAVGWLWRRKHRLQRQLAEVGCEVADEGRSKHSSGGVGSLPTHWSYDKQLSGQPSGKMSNQTSGELHSQFLRTRFGPIDGLQLGELLGRGAFGRVYRGRWKGAVVAVKVVDHRVQPGKTQDLSREPLLSMSVSHPNVVQTHKMCVVKVNPAAASLQLADPLPGGTGSSSSGSGGRLAASGSGGRLVPAIDGSGGMVEIVSPHDVLQPGLYETWLVCEHCDRGALSDIIASTGGCLAPDSAQRDIVVVLCLLDIALGLEYLHSSTVIHGDLKPANVMLKSARNDRRGFVCKLGDFGLSRMLGQDQSHVDTQSYGTASYAAPELLSQGKLTKAADIYSLGIIMWELAAGGEEPYAGLTAMQVILQVSQHQHRPEPPASCPPALADLMRRCWHEDAAQRPTAEQVVEELRLQFLSLRPTPQQPPAASAPPPPAAAT